MKKIVALFLLVTLVVSNMFIVNAETVKAKTEYKISETRAVSLAKTVLKKGWKISIPKNSKAEVKIVEVSYNFLNDYYQIKWNLNCEKIGSFISVKIDAVTGFALGVIISGEQKGTESKEIHVKLKDDKAKQIAENFVKKMFPTKLRKLELVGNKINSGLSQYIAYTYIFQRKENGIFVDKNYIAVEVDSDTNYVSAYECVWYNNEFKKENKVISSEEALSILIENTNLLLTFKKNQQHTNYSKLSYLPVYKNITNEVYAIDAINGNIINHEGLAVNLNRYSNISEEQKNKIARYSSPIKLQSTPITEARAKELGSKIINSLFGDDFTISNCTFIKEKNKKNTCIWKVFFSNNQKNESYSHGRIMLDALSERLLFAVVDNDNKDITPLSWEDGYNRAMEVVGNYYSDKIYDINTKLYEINNKYRFVFNRVVDDTQYMNNGIAILLNKTNNKIVQVSFTWDIEPPTVDSDIIDVNTAKNSFIKNYKPQLFYAKVFNQNSSEVKSNYRLVYNLPYNYSSNIFIDARNKNFINDNCIHITNIPTYFESKKLITKYEALHVLLKDRAYHEAALNHTLKYTELKFSDIDENNLYYDVIRRAFMLEMFDNEDIEFNGDKFITREDLAVLLVRRLKLEPTQELKKNYVLPVSDQSKITKNKYAYVAIAYKYGILLKENYKINPHEAVNKADLYIAYANFKKILNNQNNK